jgi:hypothetical protein
MFGCGAYFGQVLQGAVFCEARPDRSSRERIFLDVSEQRIDMFRHMGHEATKPKPHLDTPKGSNIYKMPNGPSRQQNPQLNLKYSHFKKLTHQNIKSISDTHTDLHWLLWGS